MEKKWTKLFQFDRPEGSFELLETERGEPGLLGAEKYSTRPQPSKKDPAEGKISSSLSENEARLRREFRTDINKDVILRPFMLGGEVPALLAIINGMAGTDRVNDFVLRDGMKTGTLQNVSGDLAEYALRHIFTVNEAVLSENWHDAKDAILEGRTAVFIEGAARAVLMDTRGFEKRNVGEAENEKVILGPREGFTEAIRTNITLIRRIVKCDDLVCEFRYAGGDNNVALGILYREGIANEDLVQEVKRRLAKVDTRMMLSAGTLEQLTEEHPFSPLPQQLNTERPDRAAAYLMQGHVVLLLEGSPFASILPATLFSLMATSEDSYAREPIGTVVRVIRYAGALLSILLPGYFLALCLHHPGLLSSEVLSTIISSRRMVFVPLPSELLILLLVFQLVREAGLRVPGGVGQAIGIIGGLVMGQAAVAANLVSTVALILVALTGLGNFAIPDYSTQLAATYFRLLFVLAAWAAGLLGMIAALVILAAYMASLKSYGVPFLAPFAPKTHTKRPVILRGRVTPHRRAADIANTKEGTE